MSFPNTKILLRAITTNYLASTSLATSIGSLFVHEAPKKNETGISVEKPYTVLYIRPFPQKVSV